MDSKHGIIVSHPREALSFPEAASSPQAGQLVIGSHYHHTGARVRLPDDVTPFRIVHRLGAAVGKLHSCIEPSEGK